MINVFLLIIIILLILIGFYKNKLFSNKKSIFSKRGYIILLILIVFVGLFVRLYKFGSIPDGFNQDGAMAVVDGISLAKYGTDRYGMLMPVHLTAWGYGQMSSLLSYFVAIFYNLFGFSFLVVRLPILIISLVASVCFYFLVRDIFGRDISLIALFLLAINPWHIMQSRWVLDCNLFPHFLIIGMFLLNKGINKKIYLYLSMILFGLSMYCYGISIYTVPLLLLFICVYFKKNKIVNIKDIVICIIIYLFFSWPFILTMIINYFKIDSINTPLFTIPFFKDSVRSSDILFFSGNFIQQLFINFSYFLRVVILQAKDLPWNDIDGFGSIYKFSLPLVIFGSYILFSKTKNNVGAKLIIIMLFICIWCGLTTNYININRINMIFYVLIILMSLSFHEIVISFKNFKYVLCFIYIGAFLLFSFNYFVSYKESVREYFFADFKNALLYVKEKDYDKLFITTNTQYDGSKDVSEILTIFYLEIDSKYYQGKYAINDFKYNDKYNYVNMKLVESFEDNSIYILKKSELKYFEEYEYNKKCFGQYCVIKSVL